MTEMTGSRQCLGMALGLAQIGVKPALRAAPPEPDFGKEFLSSVGAPSFDVLFEYLPDILFFAKDRDGRFTRASRGFVRLVGADSESAVVGGRDVDFFPRNLAEAYAHDDHEVMTRGEAIIDKAELVQNLEGGVDWCRTTKLPLLDERGHSIGVCGIVRDMKRMERNNAAVLFWAPVLEVMLNDYANALKMSDLAERVALSVSQFNRAFRKRFRTTPHAYLSNIRLNAACQLLVASDLPIAEIALRTGFYDQSHFTSRFVRRNGVPPSQYRASHAGAPPSRSARVSSNKMRGSYIAQRGIQL